ncbi:DUF882 domain-containing protein [Phenylobacterium sp. LH3H17]|uniref:DUF882 domain-containing protein n=1 Tax=Phenylobacterium sp. LH3H17 TaxID=2903901 RepID=UPI0020CA0034|nr:DUF882 domain-containing protein [Phenylobacterium sp. LH3H17]UTP39933.1 DUF882 domain-containing protein [Phenylobacterium sp. LH3H17]
MSPDRRRLLAAGVGFLGATACGARAYAAAPRRVSLLNLHTGEAIRATYFEGGGYMTDALGAIDKVLRDHRTGEVHAMDRNLLDLLATLTDQLGSDQPVQVISGYRSPASNAALHRKSSGVATRSLHMDGKAMDIRIPGAPLSRVRQAALNLQRGGVGYYPGSDFVHIDVGRPRQWVG